MMYMYNVSYSWK